MLAAVLAAACAHKPPHATEAIGPFPSWQGRMLVLAPGHRLQLLVRWQSAGPNAGWARFTHPASGRIVEVRWHGRRILIRDDRSSVWRAVASRELERLGLVLPPAELGGILTGRIPAGFKRTPANHPRWQGARSVAGRVHRMRIDWMPEQRTLELTDLSAGARIRILIGAGD